MRIEMDNVFLRLPMAVLMTLLASCASVSRREGAEQVQTLLGARVADARVWNRDATGADVDARVGQLVAAPLTPASAQQVALFPETNPLLDELKDIDVNSLSPIEALNKLFEWQKRFGK